MTATSPRTTVTTRALAIAATLASAAALGAALAADAEAKPRAGKGKGGVKLKKLGEFERPVHVQNAPGFKRLLFVVEQPGRIRVLRRNKAVSRPFLEITSLVQRGGEQGLLSVAFPRNYKRSGLFYVYYTARGGQANRVDELRRATPTTADPASRRTVLEMDNPESNHNGGQLQFGRDGHLYIGTGDGGGGGDPYRNGQNPDTLLGKLLRIDPRPGSAGAYGAPPGNPFAGGGGAPEVFSLGLRNPWRFSFDRKRIAIADVGQSQREEVNYLRTSAARGANFGWNAFEGTRRFDTTTPVPRDHTPPIFEYDNSGANCSITGGHVVRDRKLKSLYGRYLYADLCAGRLRSFVPKAKSARRDRALGIGVTNPTSFGQGVRGRSYVASHEGGVFKLNPRKRR